MNPLVKEESTSKCEAMLEVESLWKRVSPEISSPENDVKLSMFCESMCGGCGVYSGLCELPVPSELGEDI